MNDTPNLIGSKIINIEGEWVAGHGPLFEARNPIVIETLEGERWELQGDAIDQTGFIWIGRA